MTDAILLRETRGHIRILTINRPERSNAMSPELTEQLIDAFVHDAPLIRSMGRGDGLLRKLAGRPYR